LSHPNPENLVISDISWNATGVLVAASYVDPENEGSSSRKGMICLWSPYKRNFHPGQPEIIITTVKYYLIYRIILDASNSIPKNPQF
jgi:hypothetical protein